MAATTPDEVDRHSIGNLSLVIAKFPATVDDGDTWASGMKGVVGFWAQDIDNPTTQASVGVAVTHASGTFTLYPAEDNKNFYLFVLQAG